MKKYDIAVVIGRFQPFHNAHYELLAEAGRNAEKVVILIGSAERPRSYKNPWSLKERSIMMQDSLISLNKETKAQYVYSGIRDSIYDNTAWAARIQKAVDSHAALGSSSKICLVGHEKDETSFYLKMFPQWDYISIPSVEPLDATAIRDNYFSPTTKTLNFLKGVVPVTVFNYLELFSKTSSFKEIVEERKFLQQYKKQFENLPYPPIFVTADALVVQSGHVLMIKRGAYPGKGQWALPGGFVNAKTDASVEDACIRELKEETKIKIQDIILRRSIANLKVFDAIDRSQRGRTITHAFYIQLNDGEWNLPKVKGSDDAETAKWIPIGNLDPSVIFEDHYDIIQFFVGD
jgi:bifunctional NMN adenylyltransferase/nudix hydrolase